MTARKYTYVMRTCNADMVSYGGFIWPKKGKVACKDWNKSAQCGNGLHGLLEGRGDGDLLSWDEGAKWLIVKVKISDVVEIDSAKCKFPSGRVVFCGEKENAIKYLADKGFCDAVVAGTAAAGDRGTAAAGDRGTATAGDRGTATAGYSGTATAGDRGTAAAGDSGTIIIRRWNGKRYKFSIGHVGEDGIKKDTSYKLDGTGKFIEVKKVD